MSEKRVEIPDIDNVTCVTEQEESKLKRSLDDIEYANSQIRYVIDEYIHSERDRNILKRRYIDGIYLEPLAVEFELTSKQISNIIAKYESVIFKHLA